MVIKICFDNFYHWEETEVAQMRVFKILIIQKNLRHKWFGLLIQSGDASLQFLIPLNHCTEKPSLVHYFVQKNQIIISKWFVKFKDFLTTVAYFNAIENCKFCGHFYYFEIIHSIVLLGIYSTLSVWPLKRCPRLTQRAVDQMRTSSWGLLNW